MVDTREPTSRVLERVAPPGPAGQGWASAASAIRSIHALPMPVVMRITALGHPPILVDPRHNAFNGPDEPLPVAPRLVLVETEMVGPETGPVFPLPGKDLDALLWQIGLLAHPDEHAPWLSGERLRLRRWPNLTALECDLEQVAMVALLANAAFTPAELAEASGRPLAEARSLINAFSLMGLLCEEPAPATTAPAAALAAPATAVAAPARARFGRREPGHPTLFGRLKTKFGF